MDPNAQQVFSDPSSGPVTVEGDSDFDAQLSAFLNHRLGDDVEGDSPQAAAEPATGTLELPETPADGSAPPAPQESQPAENLSPTPEAAANAPQGAATPAAPAAAQDQVDPNLLIQMMGLTQPQPPAPQGQPQVAPPAQPATSAPADDDAPYAPFQANFRLPPAVTQAIFESEDSGQREQALVALLASFGNAVIQVADQRIKEHHAPRFQASVTESFETQQAARSIKADFDQAFPDLAQYGPIVKRAFEVVAATDPNAPYSEAMRNKVGNLARTTLRQMLGSAAPQPNPAPAPAVATKANPGKMFVAGGARPAGIGQPGDPNDPGNLLDQMSGF